MGKRSTARRLAMQALFQADLGKDDIKKALGDIFCSGEFTSPAQIFATKLAEGVAQNSSAIDALITQFSKEWSLQRISSVDRNILRLAIFELKFEGETPPAVVINEAVELAKKFGTDDSPNFVNGILGALVKGVGAARQSKGEG